MSAPAQATPVRVGHAYFTAPLGTTLHLLIGTDAVVAHLHMDGTDMREPLVSAISHGPVRSARRNGRPALAFGDTLIAMPAASHSAAVAWLAASSAYSRTEGVDA